jgi:hypothetical protein
MSFGTAACVAKLKPDKARKMAPATCVFVFLRNVLIAVLLI